MAASRRTASGDARLIRSLAAVTAALAMPGTGMAQPAEPPLAHWHHTTWVGDDSPPVPGAHMLERSPDGYLWLGASGGLLRFDGVRFVLVDGGAAPALRSGVPGEVVPQLVDRRGVMWVTRPDGAVLAYEAGTFRTVVAPGTDAARAITEDGAGRLWAHGGAAGRVYLLRGTHLARAPLPAGVPDTGIHSVVADTGTGVWIGTRSQGLWHVVGAVARRQPSPVVRPADEVRPMLQSRDGTLWAIGVGLGSGLHRLVRGRWSRVVPPDPGEGLIRGRGAFEDATGAVWLATHGLGMLRWSRGRLDQFTREHGLSDVVVHDVLIDDEGSTWITTDAGMDRLRRATFTTLGRRDGLPFDAPHRIAEDAAGGIWASGPPDREQHRLTGGAIHGADGPVVARRQPLPPGDSYELLGAARDGGVWIAPHLGGVLHVRAGAVRRFGARADLPRARVERAIETRDGALWVALRSGGIGRIRDGRYAHARLPDAAPPFVHDLAEDGRGRVWVAAVGVAPVVYELAGDSVVRRLDGRDGLPKDAVVRVVVERGDTLWGATAGSLVRIAAGRVAIVPAPALARLLAAVPHLVVSRDRLWIASEAGIGSLPLAPLHAAADDGAALPAVTLYGAEDGLRVARTTSRNPGAALRTRDGRIWFSTPAGIAVVAPDDVARNPVPPRVHVEALSLAGTPVTLGEEVAVPPNPSRVELRYTAASLRLPERVRLQYMLDGVDSSWIDGTTPRVASYTQLRPGRYRFRVRAWNEDGVPSVREATLALRVDAAWYQTWWFVGLVLLAVASTASAGALAAQRARDGRARDRLQARFEAALAERTRIAGELHDTLLQGFTGITLQLEGMRARLRTAPTGAAHELSQILETADATLREAREAVWDMRAPELNGRDLAAALEDAVRRGAAVGAVQWRYAVRGDRRRLAPELEMTVLRVCREAVANTVRHAAARTVDVELRYAPDRVQLTVQDDGRGLDPATFDPAAVAATGHWGIAGMQERARRVGGSWQITGTPGSGTRVVLSLPAE